MQDALAISMEIEALEAAPEKQGRTLQNFDYGDYNRRPRGSNEITEVIADTVTTSRCVTYGRKDNVGGKSKYRRHSLIKKRATNTIHTNNKIRYNYSIPH